MDLNSLFQTAGGQALAQMQMKAEAVARPPKPEPVLLQVKPLEVYSASELYGKKLARPEPIVEGLLAVGLALAAGMVKLGKSWFALGLAVAVALGEKFLGMRTRQGDVLYLDLESRQYRVKDRLERIMPGNFPERLYFAHEAERTDTGLIEQLDAWVKEHPEASLIIIDTLARVKGGGRRGENAYEADSRIFGELQRFAQRHKLAVLVVHHLRKSSARGEDGDPVERISGSMGLAGICDTIMLLSGKRGEAQSTLSVISRDFDRGEYILQFDGGLWRLQSTNSEAWREEQEYRRSGVVRGVLALMRIRPSWQGTVSELLDAMQTATREPLGTYTAAQVGRELERVNRSLYERDNVFTQTKRTGRARIIYITQVNENEL